MEKNKLNKNEIADLLPHREPMLLIDELYVGVAGKGFGTRLSSAQYMIVMPNK